MTMDVGSIKCVLDEFMARTDKDGLFPYKVAYALGGLMGCAVANNGKDSATLVVELKDCVDQGFRKMVELVESEARKKGLN